MQAQDVGVMSTPGESVREFYRQQGADRERLRILTLLEMLENHHAGSLWSPKYILDLINRVKPEGEK